MNLSILTSEIALRQNADYYSRFLSALPDPDPVLQKLGKGIDAYRELTTDAHLYAALQQRKAGITAMPWHIQAEPDLQELLSYALSSIDMDNLIHQILNAPLYGYSVLEVLWKKEEKNGRVYIIPSSVEEKPQEWFYFDSLNRLVLRTNDRTGGRLLPPYKFLLARNNPTYINPYGEKALSRCYWPVIFKKNGLEFWVLFTERYGLPFIVGKQPASATEEDAGVLLSKLEEMISSSAAVIPDNSSVDIISFPSGASIDAYRYFLEFMNSEISKAILTQTLTTELQNRGSYAAASVHKEQLSLLQQSDARLVKKTINTLITWILEINGAATPNTGKPSFEFIPQKQEVRK